MFAVQKTSKKSKKQWRPLKSEMHLWPDVRFKSAQAGTAKAVKEKKKQTAKVKQTLKSAMVTRNHPSADKSGQKWLKTRGQPVVVKDLWANEGTWMMSVTIC